MLRRGLILIFLMTSCRWVSPQEFRAMFYNTENLFDTVDDSLKNDSEFLPDGDRRWTNTRYYKKLAALSRAIVAAGGWDTPALVGLAEVENEKVAWDLAKSPLLVNSGYGVVHRNSPDQRGIDLCLLYRTDYVRITDVRSWIPKMDTSEVFESRNLLYIKCIIYGDTLHTILCHLPSRRGGTLAADNLRGRIMMLIESKVDSLHKSTGTGGAILIMGDFNMTPDDPFLENLVSDFNMVNLTTDLAAEGKGSYKYRGIWEMIDQIFVSKSMTTENGHFMTGLQYCLFPEAPFLLEEDPDYPGKKPFSTYRNYKWSGGYSDHLPVIVTITHL